MAQVGGEAADSCIGNDTAVRSNSAGFAKILGPVVKQDWVEAAKLLRSFGDVYPTRRKKEATLLEKIK